MATFSKKIFGKIGGFFKKVQTNFSSKRALKKEKRNDNSDQAKVMPLHKAAFTFNVTFSVIKQLGIILIVSVLLIGGLVGGIGAGYFAYLVSDEKVPTYEELSKNIHNLEEVSNLYFANDVPLGTLKTDLVRINVGIQEMSPYLQQAIIATEDEHFYEHDGVVPKAVVRALLQEVTGSASQTGGSTLTQQLVKQQILTNEVSFKRKANEILLAYHLENHFSKQEILEAYLNVSGFGRNNKGQNIAGVEAAAIGIFGKHANELTLSQAAYIAGLPQSPSAYTPYTNTGELRKNLASGIERRNTVLFRMLRENFITQEEYDIAIAYDITQDFLPTENSSTSEYGYVYNAIEKEARLILMQKLYEEDGLTSEAVNADEQLYNKYYEIADKNLRMDGLKIHSTIDKSIYDAQQQVIADYGDALGTTYSYSYTDEETGQVVEEIEPVQVASTLIDNETGRILSFVGGRDFELTQLNHAFDTRRQPGSTIKPILVYAPALEKGVVSPSTIVADTKLAGNYSPNNYDGGQAGLIQVREALKFSYNHSAVKIYQTIMNDTDFNPIDKLKEMGITSLDDTDYDSRPAALGGLTNGVSVLEQTNAFATFANDGTFVDAYLIDRITDKAGNVIYAHEPVVNESVYSPQTAYLLLDMMRGIFQWGPGARSKANLSVNSDWTGKTGTTDEFRDGWFIGFNPKVTLSIWTGYDNKFVTRRLNSASYNETNFDVWTRLANAAYGANPEVMGAGESFYAPNGIVSASVLKATGMLPGKLSAPDGTELEASGEMVTGLFNSKFLPTTTKYDFALGATQGELDKFWHGIVEDAKKKKEEEEKEKKEKEEKEEKEKKDKEAQAEKQEQERKEKEKNKKKQDVELNNGNGS
ncbi:transglycosylase domain-containing protein [Isobaculum melis]|nr:transglycosylase domain-containing protein [Isobaculum melis]